MKLKFQFFIILFTISFSHYFKMPVVESLIRNYEYVPKYIPDNYIELFGSRTETPLLKIDLENAICEGVNLREISILELQDAMNKKKLTSAQLTGCYLNRIELMNPQLNAILEINSYAIETAQWLDLERSIGFVRGPLHGIPVLLKDSIGTAGDGMETTAGALALLGLKPKSDSEVVQQLRNAGAIIIGKANLSEFGNFRSTNMPNGWSGRGGRTNNVYIRSADSCGSSSGSAVAVSANLVPVALGGETDGSIICPSLAASLVGLKTSLRRVSTEGTIGISVTQDVIGPIARSVNDAALVFDAISETGFNRKGTCFEPDVGFKNCKNSQKFRIGVLRTPDWEVPQVDAEQLPVLEKILGKLSEIGHEIIDPIIEANGTRNSITDESEIMVLLHEFKAGLNNYLKTKVIRPRGNNIRTLADIIAFNIKFPPKDGYNQQILIDSESTDGLENTTYLAHKVKNQIAAQNYVNFLLTKDSLDAIVILSDNSTTMPAVSGYPHITVQAGFQTNGLPFGISFYGQKNSEENLLMIAYELEKVYKARQTSMFID